MRIHYQICDWCMTHQTHISHGTSCRCQNCGMTSYQAAQAWLTVRCVVGCVGIALIMVGLKLIFT